MEKSQKMLPVLLLVLLLISTDVGMKITAEARGCKAQSHNFKGACFSDHNCKNICLGEHFHGGICEMHHFQSKCFCTKEC